MFNIISIVVVAVLGVVGNIFYFEYRLKKEHNKKTIKDQQTKLLLPLYIIFKTDELVMAGVINDPDGDPYEFESDKPDRLINLVKNVLDKNLYLADDDLQALAMQFLEWAYIEDREERYQKVYENVLEQDKIVDNFRTLVYKKYDENRKKYLK